MSSQYRKEGGGVVEGQSGVLHNQRVRGREKE